MKILYKGEPIPQFSHIKLMCKDEVLIEMLAIAAAIRGVPKHDARWAVSEAKLSELVSQDVSLYDFDSGAKLFCHEQKKDEFVIYNYASSGEDALSAMEELKTLYSLRKAQYHAKRMGKRELRTTLEWARVASTA